MQMLRRLKKWVVGGLALVLVLMIAVMVWVEHINRTYFHAGALDSLGWVKQPDDPEALVPLRMSYGLEMLVPNKYLIYAGVDDTRVKSRRPQDVTVSVIVLGLPMDDGPYAEPPEQKEAWEKSGRLPRLDQVQVWISAHPPRKLPVDRSRFECIPKEFQCLDDDDLIIKHNLYYKPYIIHSKGSEDYSIMVGFLEDASVDFKFRPHHVRDGVSGPVDDVLSRVKGFIKTSVTVDP